MADGFVSAMHLIQTDNHGYYGNWCRDHQNAATINGLKAIKTNQSAVTITDWAFSAHRLGAIIRKPDTSLKNKQDRRFLMVFQ